MRKLAVLLGVLAVVPLVCAQSFTGAIPGTIKDPSGAVMPAVTINITNAATNIRTELLSDDQGNFMAPELQPGRYTVEATLPGFKRAVREGVVLQVQQRTQVDIVMAVGEVSESIEVTAVAQLTETTTSALGKIVDNRSILNLPLNTRNVYSLIFLTPGITGTVGNDTTASATRLTAPARPQGHADRRRDGDLPDGQRIHQESRSSHRSMPSGSSSS